jgi:DNA-binding transcriptional MerR regulator
LLHYSIKDLEKLSGIKAHTLRIWEQRYGILKPERTNTNIRLYSNQELKHILNIAILNNKGYKISRIAELSNEQIANEVIKVTEESSSNETVIDLLIIAMSEMDEDRFEKTVNTSILNIGFEETMNQVVYPFLKKIGIMWQAGAVAPAQEHFISNLVRQKLIVAIDSLIYKTNDPEQTFLLFLLEGELHEISLLYTYYLLKKGGKRVIYLGQSVPYNDLQSIIDTKKPAFVVSIFTCQLINSNTQDYINQLSSDFTKTKIMVSGFQVMNPNLITPPNITIFKEPYHLLDLIK